MAKMQYKEKIEWQNCNLGSAWDGMKTVVGTKPKKKKNTKVALEG